MPYAEVEKVIQILRVAPSILEYDPAVRGHTMAMVRPSFLQGVQERVHRAGALLIADEVLVGFGRCGALFACQRAGAVRGIKVPAVLLIERDDGAERLNLTTRVAVRRVSVLKSVAEAKGFKCVFGQLRARGI